MIKTNRRPVGVIDSGVGGLSTLSELRRALPYEDFIYIADSAKCPYGPRPAEEIRDRLFALTDRLAEDGAKLIVLACNSATVAGIAALRERYPTPFAGTEPAVKPAAALTRTGVVAVLATEASVNGEKFHRLVNEHAESRGVRVITRPCPEFVALVEAGETDTPRARATVAAVLGPLLAEGADTVVLGCTHFPFLLPAMREFAGAGILFPDTGEAVARRAAHQLEEERLASPGPEPGGVRAFTTGDPEKLAAISEKLSPGLVAGWMRLSL